MKILKELIILKNPEKAKILRGFFKTQKGQYGEGDLFLGITIPKQREIVKKYWRGVDLKEIKNLLYSQFHEARLTALLLLVERYKKNLNKEEIFLFFIKHSKRINNWDLVDLSAPNIIGDFLLEKDKSLLYKLAKSNCIWEKRIAIVSTLTFIRQNKFQDTLKISKNLLKDKNDLINKAVGWMLRELGKRDIKLLESFLENNYREMSRTTLRYSIERFEDSKRKYFLNKQ